MGDLMPRIEDDDPITFLGKKGPIDWIAHRAAAATSDGNAAASCSDKGAKRALVVREHEKPYVHWCSACYTAAAIEEITRT